MPPTERLVNLTPHELTIFVSFHAQPITLPKPPEGTAPARRASMPRDLGMFAGVQLATTVLGPVEGLPDPEPGVVFVVSAIVRAGVPHRTDVASPGELVRDAKGQPVGCRGLVVNAPPAAGGHG